MAKNNYDIMDEELMDNPEALFDEAVQETEEEKEEVLKENPYYLGELEEKGFKTDGTGVYAPYIPPIYLKLSRDDKKTFSFAFYKETGENEFKQFSQLYSKQKSIIEVDKERTQTIDRMTKDKGMPQYKRRKEDKRKSICRMYKKTQPKTTEWLEKVALIIIRSCGLEIIKNKHYYPVDTKTTGRENTKETTSENRISSLINTRTKPVLTNNQKQEALEVETKLKEYDKGFIEYINKVLKPKHIGDNKNIIRKILAEFSIINGWGSYFIMTTAEAENGKSFEDEIVLKFIPDRYVLYMNEMTDASFLKKSEIDKRYFDRLIVYFGDLGSKEAFEKVKNVFNIIKILITENKYHKALNEIVDGKWEDTQQDLTVDSIGAVFQTLSFDFLDIEGNQLASRTVKATSGDADTIDVLEQIFNEKSTTRTRTNQKIRVADAKIKKFQSYLLYLITKDIEVINPWKTVFIRFVKESNTPYRDLEQIMNLFKAYCTITYFNCKVNKDDGLLIASKKQVETFMDNISLENTLPPLESEFLKMLIGKDTKKELTIIETNTEDNTPLNPLNPYFNTALEEIGYGDCIDDTSETVGNATKGSNTLDTGVISSERIIVTIDTIPEYKQKEAIAKLLQLYRLKGRSVYHEENAFFTVSDVKRVYWHRKTYKNIDDIPKLLNKLYKNSFIDKVDYKDAKRQNIYYLTSKCNDINSNITVTETDVSEARRFLQEEVI